MKKRKKLPSKWQNLQNFRKNREEKKKGEMRKQQEK